MQHLVPPSFLFSPGVGGEHMKHLTLHPLLPPSPSAMFGLDPLMTHQHLLPPPIRHHLYAYPPLLPPTDLLGKSTILPMKNISML